VKNYTAGRHVKSRWDHVPLRAGSDCLLSSRPHVWPQSSFFFRKDWGPQAKRSGFVSGAPVFVKKLSHLVFEIWDFLSCICLLLQRFT